MLISHSHYNEMTLSEMSVPCELVFQSARSKDVCSRAGCWRRARSVRRTRFHLWLYPENKRSRERGGNATYNVAESLYWPIRLFCVKRKSTLFHYFCLSKISEKLAQCHAVISRLFASFSQYKCTSYIKTSLGWNVLQDITEILKSEKYPVSILSEDQVVIFSGPWG